MSRTSNLILNSTPSVSFRKVIQFARCELLSTLRLFRFWLIALLLSGSVLSAYVLACLVYVNIAPFNVSFIGGTPSYLLGNLDPVYFFFFQAGVLLLTFDHGNRIQRNRLLEVIESQPITNLEFQLGRTLCYSGLIWGLVCVNVLLMQGIGFVSQLFNFDIADTIQPHSMFNLLVVDAPVALLFWTSLFLLLTNLLRSRMLVLVTSVVAMLIYYLLVLNTPYSFVDLLSHSSNQTLFISDIIPALPSATSWIMRMGALLIGVALLALGAWLCHRTDSTHATWTKALPLTALGVGVLVVTAGVVYELRQSNEIKSWKEAHLAYDWNTDLDVQSIRGSVRINPRQQLHIDLAVDFVVKSPTPVSSLVFTLNPGYQIAFIHLNETHCEFDFEYGILEVSVPFEIEPDADYSLNIEASGRPDPRFAYLNTPYDYTADTNFPVQALRSFGTDGSIYNSKFVALMPGVYWYPVPGTVPRIADDNSFRSDFFYVELQVQLDAPPSWNVVGPGISLLSSEQPTSYLSKPNIPITSIGLFASEFVKVSHDFQHTELVLYIHSRHAKQFKALERHRDKLLIKIQELLNRLNDDEISSPFETIAFVEVPNQLRTVGGGWHMERLNSLPGMVLMKEIGFPTMNIHRMVSEVEQVYEGRENISNWIWLALRNATTYALANDNLFDAFQDQLWNHIVSASGEHHRTLDLVFRAISKRSSRPFTDELFSIYATAQTARLTGLNFPSALGLGRRRGGGLSRSEELRNWESRYKERPVVWDVMERTALTSLNFNPESYRQDIEVLLLKSKLIADTFKTYPRYIEEEQFDQWIVSLRKNYAGQQFSFDDAMMHARNSGIDITLLLSDWFEKDSLAGFEASRGTTIRIAADTEGMPRYLFSYEIANTQPTAGLVTSGPKAFVLAGNTSKRVTFTGQPDSSRTSGLSFSVNTGLSLNRGPIGFYIPTQNIEIDESISPYERIEDSSFLPQQIGIVVDDLDAGFIVHQSEPFYSQFRFYPRDWFLRNFAHDVFDGTLPDIGSTFRYSVPRVFWLRRTEPNAYGQYRRTTAISSVGSSKKLHPAKFIAEIPDSGLWSLDFHIHEPIGFRRYRNIESFNIEVENNSNRWIEDFSPDPWETGWKTIGHFDLVAGKTDVVIVGTTKPSDVYADAIRWRRKIVEDEAQNPITP